MPSIKPSSALLSAAAFAASAAAAFSAASLSAYVVNPDISDAANAFTSAQDAKRTVSLPPAVPITRIAVPTVGSHSNVYVSKLSPKSACAVPTG